MILLADFSDSLNFGMLILTVTVPAVGLVVSGATLNKRGLNPWCGWSTIVFFCALLAAAIVWTLGARQGLERKVMLYILLGCCGIHVVSALMAMYGLSQVRRKRKWAHGRRRGLWMFWLNVAVLFLIGFWCAVHVFPFLSKVFKA
jgi:hypothetical protein